MQHKIEIRKYENGYGLWINDKWIYGNPNGRCDANTVAHIIAGYCTENGFPISYRMTL